MADGDASTLPRVHDLSGGAPPIRIVEADCALAPSFVSGAILVHADPPWSYANNGRALQGIAAHSYGTLPLSSIAAHVDASYDAAARDAYLLLWTTWPKLDEWLSEARGLRWTYKSGGVWCKSGSIGVGFHWRGDSEPLLLYTRGSPRPLHRRLRNTHVSERTAHSEKPEAFLRSCVEAFAPEGSTVLDLYAGLAPMARACRDANRSYVGVEIDAGRIAEAIVKFKGTSTGAEVGSSPPASARNIASFLARLRA